MKWCAGCRARGVRVLHVPTYVHHHTTTLLHARVDAGGRAACQLEAWGGHKEACKAAVRARKKLEAAA